MRSNLSCSDHTPDTTRSRRCAPHPDRDASEYRCRSGAGVPNWTPLRRWDLTIHQDKSSFTSWVKGTRREGGFDLGDQCVFKCHCRECIWSRLWGTSLSKARWPKTTCQSWAGGADMVQSVSATDRNFSTRTWNWKILAASVSMVIVCGLRGYEIWLLLVYHDPEGVTNREQILDVLFGLHLRRGEDQPVVQVPKKTNPVWVCPCRHSSKHLGGDLWGSRQSETQGLELIDCPFWQEPQ